MSQETYFLVSHPDQGAAAPAFLVQGLDAWASSPVAYAQPSSEESPGTVWLADLPADPGRASGQLDRASAALHGATAALATAELRLGAYVDRRRLAPSVAGAHATWGAAPQTAEQELDRLLQDMGTRPAAASYGWRDRLGDTLARAADELGQFLNHLERQVAHFAWVETRIQHQLVARTQVTWLGDASTYWQPGAWVSGSRIHQRTLGLALETRQSQLVWLGVLGACAVRLAKLPILLGTPGGALLALPLAWKFLQDVRTELATGPGTPAVSGSTQP